MGPTEDARGASTGRVVGVLQARCGSTRLPAKSLIELGGIPMVQHVLTAAAAASLVDDVILATTTRDQDDPLAELA
ncbi:MAG: cytidylyltransferase domain-containing protein, partial [Thermoleophilaceae bacterium]